MTVREVRDGGYSVLTSPPVIAATATVGALFSATVGVTSHVSNGPEYGIVTAVFIAILGTVTALYTTRDRSGAVKLDKLTEGLAGLQQTVEANARAAAEDRAVVAGRLSSLEEYLREPRGQR